MDEMEIEGMEKKAKVPKLRFPGFTGEWEERKLREVMERYEKPVVTPHTGYNRLGIRSHAKGTFHNHVEAGEELETAQMYEVVANNFIVNITFAWEHAVAITDKDDTGKLVSHRFPQFQFTAGNIPCFFKYVIADPRFKYHLGLASPGGAGRNRVLNINEMLKYVVRVPAREEQEQIGKFLGKVDENILFYQRKLTHLQAKKKCLLQKMFPKKGERFPELRFPGFTNAWEQKKLGNLVSIKSGQPPSEFEIGQVLYVKVDDLNHSVREQTHSQMLVSDNEHASKVSRGSIIFPKRGAAIMTNKVRIMTVDGYIDTNMMALEPKNIYGNFLYVVIDRIGLYKIADTSTIPQINNKHIEPYEITLPKTDEQQEIGEFFKSLDNLIILHERKLAHLQTQKKALLQQMFV